MIGFGNAGRVDSIYFSWARYEQRGTLTWRSDNRSPLRAFLDDSIAAFLLGMAIRWIAGGSTDGEIIDYLAWGVGGFLVYVLARWWYLRSD